MRLEDMDGDGKPEFLMNFINARVSLFLEASDAGLSIDLNPALYRKGFEQVSRVSRKSERQFRQYLVYGFITGKLTREAIEKKVANRDDEEKILTIIDTLPDLTEVLHPKHKFTIKKHEGGM